VGLREQRHARVLHDHAVGRKLTNVELGLGPAEIAFNALWDQVYIPVIRELGYEPVRADQDPAR
jgi:hypothetical protein